MKMKNYMKTFFKILLHYLVIPFGVSFGSFLLLSFLDNFISVPIMLDLIFVPILMGGVYVIFHKKMDLAFAAKLNAFLLSLLTIVWAAEMLRISGGVNRSLAFTLLSLQFFPTVLDYLFGTFVGDLFPPTVLLSYAVALLVCAWYEKINIKKLLIPLVISVICVSISIIMYSNRPSVKYAGHGFDYMGGYSSTDLSDYMVYSQNSKLATLEHAPDFVIENENDMPILDGAEACYPLYAAFAKAIYKDIDKIERNSEISEKNGKIVTFTNTIQGFDRLLDGKIDMFFGAKPSNSQMEDVKLFDVELNITPIAREAFVFFIEPDNPVDNLTTDQLKAIYHGEITNWNELGGKNMDIKAFQRPKNSGSQTMMEYFMGDVSLKKPQTYETIAGMGDIIENVAQYTNENGAIGYSFRYFVDVLHQEKNVKMLSIDGIYPSIENIENGKYPIVVDVNLITNKKYENSYIQKMTDFILSDDGQSLIRKTGYAGVAR